MHHFRKLAVLSLAAGALAACSDTVESPLASGELITAEGLKVNATKLSGSQTCGAAPSNVITLADRDTISGQLSIPSGCILRVNPVDSNGDGQVTIFADAGVAPTAIVINVGAQIDAQGDSVKPIVFTPTGASPAPGAWGGIVLIGDAPVNTPSATVEGLPGSIAYGGTDATDDSGILKYVRIEYAGRVLSADNELNGLSLYGVGSGTDLEYIEVYRGSDDGIEFFGGTADITYAVVVGAEDDSFDYSYGWSGFAQFVIVKQGLNVGDKGIEADNNDAGDPTASPLTDGDVWNFTLVGRDASYADSTSVDAGNIGIQLRRAVASRVRNAIVIGFDEAFNGTGANTGAADSLSHSIFYGKAGYTAGNVTVATTTVTQLDPQLVDPFNNDFHPALSSRASTGAYPNLPTKTGMIRTSFRGAVPRTTTNGVSPNWYSTGWARF